MNLEQFILELAQDFAQELRTSPAGEALRALLNTPKKPKKKRTMARRNPSQARRRIQANEKIATGKSESNARPPAPGPTYSPSALEIATAAVTLAHFAGVDAARVLQDVTARKEAARLAAFKTHPDHGGKPEDFLKVTKAKEVLRLV